MIEIKGYDGFLFVGDPHLWSLQPSTRKDVKFSDTVLNKIEQCVNLALDKNLYLIFLGDLFDSHEENDITLLTKLTRILKKSKTPFSSTEGNHEKSQTKLSDDVALKLLQEAETLYVFEQNKIWGKFKLNDGSIIYIGSTPYGEKIPTSVSLPESEIKKNPDYKIIWLTHHDLDFGDTYPGAIPVKEIDGAYMLINGHIHSSKKPMLLGKMKAHNPGNITRRSTDCKDHVPSAWSWTPNQGQDLVQNILKYEPDIFNMVGKQIQVPSQKSIVPDSLSLQMTSQFVQKMQEQSLLQEHDPNQSDDGEMIKQNLKTVAKAMNLDNDFTNEILQIADESILDMRK